MAYVKFTLSEESAENDKQLCKRVDNIHLMSHIEYYKMHRRPHADTGGHIYKR